MPEAVISIELSCHIYGRVLVQVFKIDFAVACIWSMWDEWSSCSKSCGPGSKMAKRKIAEEAKHGGKACVGDSKREEQCNQVPCPGINSLSHHYFLNHV